MALDDVRFKAVVLLLLWMWNAVIVLCFVVRYFVSILVLQSSRWGRVLCLSFWCLMMVVWLFLTKPWVCLQFMIVVFPDHTHFSKLFLIFFCTFRAIVVISLSL